MYPDDIVTPMRKELTDHGFSELRNATQVEAELTAQTGTTLVAINSICGCAAGAFRPALIAALESSKRPQKLTTVFAGQDQEATNVVRSKILGYPPSSPSAALFKDGEVVFMLQRKDIEGFSPQEIAIKLKSAFDKYC